MKIKFDGQLLEEIEDIIDINKEHMDKSSVGILFDGKQFAVKIPKKLAMQTGIKAADRIEFIVKTSYKKGIKKTKLEARLVAHEDKDTSQE